MEVKQSKHVPKRFKQTAFQAVNLAFEMLGGVEGFTKWAAKNQTEFYRIYAKTLPRQGGVGSENPAIQFNITAGDLEILRRHTTTIEGTARALEHLGIEDGSSNNKEKTRASATFNSDTSE